MNSNHRQNQVCARAARLRAFHFIFVATLGMFASGLSCTDNAPVAPAAWNGPPRSEAELVDAFAASYRLRDLERFNALLAPDYQFYLAEPAPDGTEHWGRTEELAVHQRLFHPELSVPPPDPASWVTSIDIQCTLRVPFTTDCYDPPCFPELDPLHWRVSQTDLFVSMTLHNKDGSSNHTGRYEVFEVIEDRTKQLGDVGKYLLYRRIDLGPSAPTAGDSWDR